MRSEQERGQQSRRRRRVGEGSLVVIEKSCCMLGPDRHKDVVSRGNVNRLILDGGLIGRVEAYGD
jgi:hypothetical protein